METVVVINGEPDWQSYLPGLKVAHRRLQQTHWVLRQGRLWAVDATGGVAADALLWRLGAVRPSSQHRTVLEMVRLCGIPCVNPAETLLRGYDRLGMLTELRQIGLPVLDIDVVVGEQMLRRLAPVFPVVVKVGNYHGGFGKTLVRTEEQWLEVCDLLFVTDDYITVEPYIEYLNDIRCLAIGERMWAMKRQGRFWRANQMTTKHALVDVDDLLARYTRQAMEHFGADVLGLDFLETQAGDYLLLESNDVPGLSGFPEEAKHILANRLQMQMGVVELPGTQCGQET